MYGEKLRDQVEERLSFYETGEAPRKNIDIMREAMNEVGCTVVYFLFFLFGMQAECSQMFFFYLIHWTSKFWIL